jgi:hypothetical protein
MNNNNSAPADTEFSKKNKQQFHLKHFCLELILLMVGTSFFALVGDYLGDLGIRAKGWCNLLGLICIELAIAHFIANYFTKHKPAIWSITGTMVLIQILTLIPRTPLAKANPEAHFQITLGFGHEPDQFFAFTNDKHLIRWSTNATGEAFVSEIATDTVIVIPIDPGITNVLFSITVDNTSALTAKDVQLTVGLPVGLNIDWGTPWQPNDAVFSFSGTPTFVTNLQFWTSQFTRVIYPGNSQEAFPFSYPVILSTPNSKTTGLLLIAVRSEGFENQTSVANLLFVQKSKTLGKPHVIQGQRINGKLNVTLPSDKL